MLKNELLSLRELRENWKAVNTDAMSEDERGKFLKRKEAIDLYIDGVPTKNITEKTGVPSSDIYRFIKRCMVKDKFGLTRGYEALIPYKHPKRKSAKLKQLFLKYPSLEAFVIGNYFGDKKYTLEHNMSVRTLHSKFVKECQRLGIQEYEYPFTLKDKGYISLFRYIGQLKLDSEGLSISRESKDAQQKFNSTGYGQSMNLVSLAPFGVVQIDGHRIDLLYTVTSENKDGEIVSMPATRAWLIAIIDMSTRAIIGYSVSAYENYNRYDVLQAVHNAIVPHEKIDFHHTGFQYPENGGFPSLALKETQWATFDMIMLDNAMSHLANHTVDKLTNIAKCAVNFGSVATPETRGIIERFFKTLETGGFHRLPGTTGSNPKDTKRNNPEKQSMKYQITYEDICELLEYLIAEYNNSAHSGLENQTPLQVMERRIRGAGMLPYVLLPAERPDIEKLTYFSVERTVRGGYSTGTRPYIEYLGARYHAYDVQIPMEMIKQKAYLEVNPHDVSHVDLYDKDGRFIANLVAMGEWGKYPHSVKTREAALKRKNANSKNNTVFTPNLSEYEDDLRQNSKTSRRKRTEAAIVGREMNREQEKSTDGRAMKYTDTKEIKKTTTYTKEEIDLIDSLSIEEAYKMGLI